MTSVPDKRVRFVVPKIEPGSETQATSSSSSSKTRTKKAASTREQSDKYDNVKVTLGQLRKAGILRFPDCQVKLVKCDPKVKVEAVAVTRRTSTTTSKVTSGTGAKKRKTTEKHPRYRCTKCSKSYAFAYRLTTHKCVAAMSEEMSVDQCDIYRCGICGKAYSKFLSFNSHLGTHLPFESGGRHPNEKPFQCSVCGTRYGLVHQLYRHARSVSAPLCRSGGDAYRRKEGCGHPPKPFVCNECPRSFVLESDLLYHVQFHRL